KLPGFGFIVVVFAAVEFLPRQSTIAKCRGKIGFEPNGFVVVGNGPVQIACARIGVSAAVKGGSVIRMKTYRQVEARDSIAKTARRVSRITLSDRGQVSRVVCFHVRRCLCLLLLRFLRAGALDTGLQAGIVGDALVGDTRRSLPLVIGLPSLRQLVVGQVFILANGPTPTLQCV